MARRSKREQVDWRTLIRRIKAGKCTPIISAQVGSPFSAEQNQVVEAWAEEIAYPMSDLNNLPRVTQYATIISPDILSAKEDFLDFLKERLLDRVKDEQEAVEQSAFLETLEDELYDLSFSNVAVRLGYPRYEDELENPLRILAELPLPIYLTTHYHTFLEDALRAAGKEPRTEICYWREELEAEAESVFEQEPDYEPGEAEPLVYHLHGLDAYPSSLVLTEDDYLDFLVNVSQDPEAIPKRVTQALADSSLMLLGYQLQEWDFRVIFRGLITSRRASRRLLSLSIQLTPEEQDMTDVAEARKYLERYFENFNFEIYWGDSQNFMQELWDQWQS
jgi:hypothetical protein